MAQPNLREAEWDVATVINTKLVPALDGEPTAKAIVSMLTFVLLLMRPNLSVDQAENGVRSIAAHIFEYLEMLDGKNLEMN